MILFDLLLDRLHEELRNLGRPELVPRQRSLAFLDDEEANAMLQMIHWDSI